MLAIHKLIFGDKKCAAIKTPTPPERSQLTVEACKPLDIPHTVEPPVLTIPEKAAEFVAAIAKHRTQTSTRHDILLGVGGWLVGADWPRDEIVGVLGGLVNAFHAEDPSFDPGERLARATKHLDEIIGRYRAGKLIAGSTHLKRHVDPSIVEGFQAQEAFRPAIPKFYRLADDGVYHCPPKSREDQEAQSPMWLCSHLEVRARTRSVDCDDWGLYLVWADPEGREHTWTMACELLATDGSPILQELCRCGLTMSFSRNIRELLLGYLNGCKPPMIITSVSRIGWNGNSYVLPEETIGGNDGEGAVVQSSSVHYFKAREPSMIGDRVSALYAMEIRVSYLRPAFPLRHHS